MYEIVSQKVEQAVGILAELGIDAWLTFARETTEAGDTVLPLILGQSLTWQSALLLTRDGRRIAIVGSHEVDAVRSCPAWTEVIPYVEGIRGPLRDTLGAIDPRQIALNYSVDDVKADGLSHGMFLLLSSYLADTPCAQRFTSAARIIDALRGRKTPAEVERMRRAIATTDEIFAAVARFARVGTSEAQIAAFMQGEVDRRGLGTAWDRNACPIVNTGPNSMPGHGFPSEDLRIEPGRIFHLDFGVRQEEYCSDIQRAWYVPAPGEKQPPEGVQRAFDTIVAAIDAAAGVLRPGVECWKVDQAARQVVIDAGFPEYLHATGHHVGRAAHDGGGVLGPRWERYGDTPMRRVEPGNVYTLELGIENVDGRGYLGLEEMVLVTAAGLEYLTTPQRTLPLLST